MRQPDACHCAWFTGGRCWRKFCPDKSKKAKDEHVRPNEGTATKEHRPKVLTLSESREQLKRDREANE